MKAYANAEYDHGLYRDYVKAREMKLAHFKSRMKSISSCIPTGQLLDVGCSCGYFLEVAAEQGYEVTGLEFSEVAVAAAHPSVRTRIIRAGLDKLSADHERRYDVITAFDIIEHLDSPKQFLYDASRLLRPGGAIVISTPDADHVLRYVMKSRWPMLQAMQHLTIFSKRALRLAMEEVGFQEISLSPAYKVIRIDYLIEQLRTLNPLFYVVLNAARRLVPQSVSARDRELNIGETLAVAKKAG
jgi:2-polyprenyl-3-methyl-5-hydroxy-6-metoxy-1,4-benzoquinol methylase